MMIGNQFYAGAGIGSIVQSNPGNKETGIRKNDPFGLRTKYARDKKVINALDLIERAVEKSNKTGKLDLSNTNLRSLSRLVLETNTVNLERLILTVGAKSQYPLNEANFSGADLTEVDLHRVDLIGADLTHANLSRADLSLADLTGANLTGANLSHTDFSEANLFRASLNYADLSEANLSEANLERVNLTAAHLSHADLSYADLSYANLSHANLSHADLFYADLFEANLSNAKLQEVYLHRTNLFGAYVLQGDKKITGQALRQYLIETCKVKIDESTKF